MQNLKRIILGFVSVVTLLVIMNFIYAKWFFEKDIQKHSDIVNLVREVQDSTEILYFAESSNFSFRADDVDKRKISDFVSDYFPDKRLGAVYKGALHAGNYKILLNQIPEDSNVETIIITLNMRSFNAQWIYSDLETALQKQMVLLKPFPALWNRFLLSFKGYEIKNNDERKKQFNRKWKRDEMELPDSFKYDNVIEWDRVMWHNGIKNNDGSKNNELSALACHYIKAYAFQLSSQNNNPRIKDFDEIVEIAKSRGWNLVFNLLAENVEKAQELVGNELVYLMRQNRDFLVNEYSEQGVVVVDNLEAVAGDLYIDQNWTTEHYAQFGRETIAKNVADSLKRWYLDSFHNVDRSRERRSEFFHNCDTDENWGQMQTLVGERSYSGTKSSKTGAGSKFSITFGYPVAAIPNNNFNKIVINSKIYPEQINSEVKFIAEFSGKNIKYSWNTIPLGSTRPQEWNKLEYIYTIEDKDRNADIIKIYLYNPTDTIVYLDDFLIKFK